MKSKVVSFVLSLLLIASVTVPCFGQKKRDDRAMTIEQIKAAVSDAHAKDKRLIVTLGSGGTVSGTVSPLSDGSFALRHEGLMADVVTLDYSDVVSVKGRNPFVKAIKGLGKAALITTGFAAGIPFWLAIQGLSLLFTGELYHDC